MKTNLDLDPCTYEGQQSSVSKEVILETNHWKQGVPFNNQCPYSSCSQESNGRCQTGCTATAIAIILQYHKKSTIPYDWAAMELDPSHPTVAFMMSTLGASNFLNTNYGCDNSSASNANIDRALFNYSYPNPVKTDFDYYSLKQELDNNRPGLLAGRKTSWVLSDWHVWVADGYWQLDNYTCHWDVIDGEWQKIFNSTYALIHMNWGRGIQYHGYYAFNNFDPGRPDGQTYQYDKTMYKVRPY